MTIDPRGQDAAPSNLRSINLAISSRGLEALRSVDPSIAENFLEEAIPMKGRMIHHTDGKQESQLYDPIGGQVCLSVDDGEMGMHWLIDEVVYQLDQSSNSQSAIGSIASRSNQTQVQHQAQAHRFQESCCLCVS